MFQRVLIERELSLQPSLVLQCLLHDVANVGVGERLQPQEQRAGEQR